MELALALLLAASLVALASTWSALRTEKARVRRLEDRLASARDEAPPPAAEEAPASTHPGERLGARRIEASPETPARALVAAPASGQADRFSAALVAPAERLAESIGASEPALASAAERLRAPLPPAAPVPVIEEGARVDLGTESFEKAVATAERISDDRARLADDVRGLRSAVERVAALDGGLSRGLTELSRTADALLPIASSVSGLADRANLLGLNVSLLAARAGDAGMPFEEAAVELRGLFEEARRLSRELSETARRADGGTRRLAVFVEESAGAAAAGQGHGARAAERLDALQALSRDLDRALAESGRATRAAVDAEKALYYRLETVCSSLEARTAEAARLRADAEATRAALRAATERIEALRLDGGALRAAVVRVTSGA